jgi:branched-chain amino acid transport system ATP-binding protein
VAVVTAILEVEALSLAFAGVRALDGVSLSVGKGELVAVIGPNGAGKTSLFNCISGSYVPAAGRVCLEGVELVGRPPHAIAALGVGRMFQNLALFEHLTVLDNLMLGRHHLYRTRFFHDVFFAARTRAEEVQHRRRVEEIIDFLDLERWRKMPAAILPYGVRKRVELGRALAMEPKLLLLDEPAAGLNREETEDMARFILDIQAELGVTEIVIEHDLRLVMDVADRVVVLDFGKKIAEGAPREVAEHPDVVAAYVGVTTNSNEAARA